MLCVVCCVLCCVVLCCVVLWVGMISYHEAVGQSDTRVGNVETTKLKHTRTGISETMRGCVWYGKMMMKQMKRLIKMVCCNDCTGVNERESVYSVIMMTFGDLGGYLMLFINDDSFAKFVKEFPTLRVNKASLRKDKLA